MSDESDLTTAYMLGLERGRDAILENARNTLALDKIAEMALDALSDPGRRHIALVLEDIYELAAGHPDPVQHDISPPTRC